MRVVSWMILALSCLVILGLLYYLVVGKILFKIAFSHKSKQKRVKKKNLDSELKKHKIDLCWWQKQKTKKFEIKSYDGTNLVGNFLDNKSSKCAIIFHGYGQTYEETSLFCKMFSDKNFNVLAVESRAHNSSGGNIVSLGLFEKDDVVAWANFFAEKFPDQKIVLFGGSMGAMAVCGASGENLPKNVVAIISDSAYSNAVEQIDFTLKRFGIFKNIIKKHLLSFSKHVYQLDLAKADVCGLVKKTQVPILYIHCTGDTIVPVENAQKLYSATPQNLREVYIIDGADHLRGYAQEGVEYEKRVNDFLKKRTPIQ